MTDGADASHRAGWVGELLASASFARVFTLAAFAAVLGSVAIERTAGRVAYVSIVAGLCLFGIGMLVARREEISVLRLLPTTLVGYVGWVLASVFWTSDRTATLAGWTTVTALAFLAIVIAHVRDTLQTVRALADVLRWLLGISFGLEILSGILIDVPLAFLGIRGDIAQLGPVQGLFGTRNLLGFVTVLALITFFVEYRTNSVRPGLSLFSISLAGLLAALSDSPTVLVLAVAVLAAAGALMLVRRARPERRGALQWGLVAVVLLGLAVGWGLRQQIVLLLGAGTDFSRRVQLWNTLQIYIQAKPVQGWGWFGPWAPRDNPFTNINYGLGTTHASALNGYLDILLQLGWAGLLLFLALAGAAVVRAWLDASGRRSVVYAWTPLILIAIVVDSLFESFALYGLGWMLLVVCAVRAGQSRSWRDSIDALRGRDDPPPLEGSPTV